MGEDASIPGRKGRRRNAENTELMTTTISTPAATEAPTPAGAAPARAPLPNRLASMDAYRGLVMFLMMGEAFDFGRLARNFPESGLWRFLAWHQSHVEWIGCSLHDLIQPSFSFLVGVALPFSLAGRLARGESWGKMTGHAFWRALLLILLWVWLRTGPARSMTYWTFEDTLSQNGLGYGFLFLLGFRAVRWQWVAFGVLVVGYWAAFVAYPLPGADFDYAKVGVSADWLREHGLTGLAAHWQKNSNLAWAFDTWWLNLFPREKVFTHNGGGYSTLSFIPTLATMVLGLIAGGVLRSVRTPAEKVRWLVLAGLAGLAAGWLANATGLCPTVKRIWTPAWVLFSGGWCCLFLAAFYTVVDWRQHRAWAFPLIVIGMNSIAAYCMAHLFEGFISRNLTVNLGSKIFGFAGPGYAGSIHGAATFLVLWLILLWMYRRKIFLRI